MLKVRLQRVGRKNDPSFRVVVTESQNGPQSGKFLEILGSYDARQGKPQLKGERIKYWLDRGAQASGTVNNMLVKFGIINGQTVNVLPKKKPVEKPAEVVAPAKSEAPIAEAAPVAEPEVPAEPASAEPTKEVETLAPAEPETEAEPKEETTA
jgi:small subunit ribosomal protein S16